METLDLIVKDYGDIHRHLVRYMLHKGYTKTNDFIEKFIMFVKGYGNPSEHQMQKLCAMKGNEMRDVLLGLLECLNDNLELFGLRVVEMFDEHEEDTTTAYITIISSFHFSEALESVLGWRHNEVALFNGWLSMICSSDDGRITLTEAFGVASELPNKVSHKRAQELLDQLVAGKWFCLRDDHKSVCLSVRALAELQADLLDRFALKKCVQCKKGILIKGRSLHCGKCDAYLHWQCAKRLVTNMRSDSLKCPGQNGRCGTVLTVGDHPDGVEHAPTHNGSDHNDSMMHKDNPHTP